MPTKYLTVFCVLGWEKSPWPINISMAVLPNSQKWEIALGPQNSMEPQVW